MSKILLINVDSKKYPNLALVKLQLHFQKRGDEVVWDFPLLANQADKIYVSVLYEWNRNLAGFYERFGDKVSIGGTGWSLLKRLPREIDSIKPHINVGFTTRGCIRKCPWCVVPKKEGKLHVVGDLLDLWDGKSKDVVVLDNNILGVPEHFKRICDQARRNRIRVDFNQGLDHRLLTERIVWDLKHISHIEYHFAYDDPIYKKSVLKAIELLQAGGIRRSNWLVLCGFNTTFQQDLDRINLLKDNGQQAYIMRYNNIRRPYLDLLVKWCNGHKFLYLYSWEQFINQPMNRRYKKLMEEELGK